MNENLPTNVQLDSNGNGTVSFATDVVATIAGLATTEVEGVASMWSTTGLADMLTRKMQPARNLTRGVRVEINGDSVAVNVSIVVDYGFPVPEVAGKIKENVKKNIETMTGLKVSGVDVQVQGVSFEKENRTAAELEEQQKLLLKQQSEPETVKEPARQEEPAGPEEDEFEMDLPEADEEEAPENV